MMMCARQKMRNFTAGDTARVRIFAEFGQQWILVLMTDIPPSMH